MKRCLLVLLALLPAARLVAVPATWEPRGPGGGGALFSPSLSPHQPERLFVACDMSELFESSDFGLSWTQADHRVVQGNRASKVWFTEDPNILYTIDHGTRNLVDLRQPVRSDDGGRTWSPLPGDPTGGDSYGMCADPNDARRVFVVDYNDLHASQDGGQSFTRVYQDATGGGAYLAGIFSDGLDVFIGTNAGLLVSTDGGQSFQLNPGLTGIDFGAGGEGMTAFAGAKDPTSGLVRLACVAHARGDVYLDMPPNEFWGYQNIYVMDWGTGRWEQRTNGVPAGSYPFFLGMARNDVDVMWVAGGSDDSFPVVLRTTDAGQNWSPVLDTAGNANVRTGWSGSGGDRDWWYGECAMGFEVSPVDARRAVITDFGFPHVTDDGGATWRQAYVATADEHPAGATTPKRQSYHSTGIENTTAWWLHWVDPQTIIAGYSDIQGTRSEDGGATWGFDYAGHSDNSMYHVVQRPSDGMVFAATSNVHDMYQSTRLGDGILDAGGGRVLYSTDGGNQWQALHDFGDVVMWLALHPSQPNTLYASVVHHTNGGIYVSRDIQNGAASTWTRLAQPPRTQGHPFNIHVLDDGTLVATYSGRRDPAAGDAFTNSSGVFVSNDDGVSWLDRSDAGMHYWTKDLVVDPYDATQSTWYVGVFSGWGGAPNGLGGLYRTRDRGLNWTRVLDSDRVTSIGISPTDRNEAYVTTEVEGLWHTADLDAASPSFAQDPAYPFRQPERVFWNPHDTTEIWMTSFGNGLRVGHEGVAPPQIDLWRDASLTSLAPLSAPLATILPLDAGDLEVADVQQGYVDPDAAPHPLVFYALSSATVLLSVGKTVAGLAEIRWVSF